MFRILIAAVAASVAVVAPASAHHVAEGRTPSSWTDGLLSGLSHPVIGLDHLAFIIVMGLVVALNRNGVRIAATFAGMLVLGVLLKIAALKLPKAEVLVAGSVLVAGVVLVMARTERPKLWHMFAAVGGVLHGYALGEPIAGAPSGAMVFYFAGLIGALTLIMIPVVTFSELALVEDRAEDLKVRATGGAVTALGMFFVASAMATA